MIKNSLILILILMSTTIFAQQDSSLYEKVMKIMKTELNYTFDSTSNKRKVIELGTSKTERKSLPPSYCSLPENPSPLVMKDGSPIKIDDLNRYDLDNIDNIVVMKPDDPKTAALYGRRGSVKGVILITSKKTD